MRYIVFAQVDKNTNPRKEPDIFKTDLVEIVPAVVKYMNFTSSCLLYGENKEGKYTKISLGDKEICIDNAYLTGIVICTNYRSLQICFTSLCLYPP